MKRMIRTISLIAGALLLAMTSCKTTEENYKAAYDIAVQRNQMGVDRNLSAFIEREKHLAEFSVIEGDTVRIITEKVSMVDFDASAMKNYGVVVGEFKQIFNARSYRDRINLAENDTENPAYVVMNPEKKYYVIYKGFDTKEAATAFIKNYDNFKITPPHDPWLLEK